MTIEQQEILAAVCSEYNTKHSTVLGPSRNKHITKVRRDVAQWMRDEGYSLSDIGRAMNRHHSSVHNLLHGKRQ